MFGLPGNRARPLPRQRDLLGYQVLASPNGNSLVISLNQVPGSDPFMAFRDPNIANGIPYFRPIPNGALFVISSGNTMGAASAVPFKLWVVGYDNGGGISVGAINCVVGASLPTQIAPLDESFVSSPTGGHGGSTAGTFFCAQTLTNRPYRILGYMEWAAGLATAGLWNIKPTKVQLFGPSIKKPGEPVQTVTMTTTAAAGTISTSAYSATNLTLNITPTSAANVVSAQAYGMMEVAASAQAAQAALFRGASRITGAAGAFGAGPTDLMSQINLTAPLDAVGSTAVTTYSVKARNSDNVTNIKFPTDGFSTDSPYGGMALTEIMG